MKKTQGVRDQPYEWQWEFYLGLKKNMILALQSHGGDIDINKRLTSTLEWCDHELNRLNRISHIQNLLPKFRPNTLEGIAIDGYAFYTWCEGDNFFRQYDYCGSDLPWIDIPECVHKAGIEAVKEWMGYLCRDDIPAKFLWHGNSCVRSFLAERG
jgi:hypothetical protein